MLLCKLFFYSYLNPSMFCLVCQRMRELNPDGTIKDVQSFFQEHGISVGTVLIRKADKSKCKVAKILLDTINVVSLDSKAEASIATSEIMQGLWSRCKDTPHEQEKELHGKIYRAPMFLHLMTASKLHAKLCDLAVQHDAGLNGIKMSMKPRSVIATKSFEKHKLVLVPWSHKVFFGKEEPKNCLKLQVPFEFADVEFWVKPIGGGAKTDDDIVVPYWFLSTDSSDFNMEIFWVKCDDFKLPVARNIRAIKLDETLKLAGAESKVAVEPLFDSHASGHSNDKHPKKARKS
jgi:hypothetical protein